MKTEQKIILGGVGLTVILFAAVVLFLGGQGAGQLVDSQKLIGDSGLVAGLRDAKVQVVEFSDFLCPACVTVNPTVEKILTDYSDKIAFYYRHFPIHNEVYPAAYAAEAAREQGKFLEAANWLFENQANWQNEQLSGEYFYEKFGQSSGLDKEKFLADFTDTKIRTRVNQDFSDGQALGVNATPTFFINGKKLVGVQSYETFKAEIEKAVAH